MGNVLRFFPTDKRCNFWVKTQVRVFLRTVFRAEDPRICVTEVVKCTVAMGYMCSDARKIDARIQQIFTRVLAGSCHVTLTAGARVFSGLKVWVPVDSQAILGVVYLTDFIEKLE